MANTKVSLHDVLEISSRIESKLDKMEVRITALEVWRGEIMGKITVIVGFVSLAFTMAWDYIRARVKL